MALYSYTKHTRPNIKRVATFFSMVFISLGLIILFWTLLPIISFEIFYAPKFGKLIRPIPNNEIIEKAIGKELSSLLGSSVDYTRASSWFPKAANIKISSSPDSTYFLSIPKLKIENALVIVGGEDLSKSLIHFTGPIPGLPGTPVIFGHSTLLWLYNPKDYKTIFSRLPDLNIGDEIFISLGDITYRYQVAEMKITSPEDLSVLKQNYDASYITLITCVPPGTYLKRLIIKGKLVTN